VSWHVQEREKSGTKKYPVLGIFWVKSKKVRGKGGLFGRNDRILKNRRLIAPPIIGSNQFTA
jgi:hypothetical protein